MPLRSPTPTLNPGWLNTRKRHNTSYFTFIERELPKIDDILPDFDQFVEEESAAGNLTDEPVDEEAANETESSGDETFGNEFHRVTLTIVKFNFTF